MTVATKVISALYPVVGGTAAALTTAVALQAARRFVVGKSKTPSDPGRGWTALAWTALRWAASAGVGLYAGKQLLRTSAELQPAQSKQ